jgi:hypothetical protein
MPYEKLMKSLAPTTKATVRVYDLDTAKRITDGFLKSDFSTKNDYLASLIEKGLRLEQGAPESCCPKQDQHLKDTFSSLEDAVSKVFELEVKKEEKSEANRRVIIALLCSIYHMVLCQSSGEKFSPGVVEKGLFDSKPERFKN